jgi:hypothetical protein
MNEISKLYADLSDDEIKLSVREIKEAEKTGIFPDNSMVRKLCRETAKLTQMDVSSNLLMVQINILKQASYRWLETF